MPHLLALPAGDADTPQDLFRPEEGRRVQFDHARMLVASGDRSLVAAGLAELVRRPGWAGGWKYAADGSNALGASVPPDRVVMVAANEPLTVTPSYAYAIVDVDYDRAKDEQARRRLADQVEDLVDAVRPSGVPVVRVRSGGRVGEWHNEHVWLVTGRHTLKPEGRRLLGALLRHAVPDATVIGGLVAGKIAGQQVRPPGSCHRTYGWTDLPDPQHLVEALSSPSPPQHCWDELLTTLWRRVVDDLPSDVPDDTRDPGRSDGTPASWALQLLTVGMGNERGGRSEQACKLIGHLHGRGWERDRIVTAMLGSPASQYLADRLGNHSLDVRVEGDVDRIISKHRGRQRPAVPQVVVEAAARWDEIPAPGHSQATNATAVLRAVLEESVATGHLTVLKCQRRLAIAAGCSAPTVGRWLRRWADVGVFSHVGLDDDGRTQIEIDPAELGRLLPLDRNETSSVHAPWPSLRRHDAWTKRPPGDAPRGSVALGRTGQLCALRLHRSGPTTPDDLAVAMGVSPTQSRRALHRLAYYGLAAKAGALWRLCDEELLDDLLDDAARRLGTAGILGERAGRYLQEIESHQQAQALEAETRGQTPVTVHGEDLVGWLDARGPPRLANPDEPQATQPRLPAAA